MLKEAIEKIASMAKNQVHEINGEFYSDDKLNHIPPVIYRPDCKNFTTLESITTMVKTEVNKSRALPLFVNVIKYNEVSVYTSFCVKYERDILYSAKAFTPPIKLNAFTEYSEAIIMLRSLFIPKGDIDYILELLSKISDESKITNVDNGITQTVEARAGISLRQNQTVRPRVKLAPYRTFLEVEQPESEFLLRLKEGGYIGLFEADGGMWELIAKKNIKEYFLEALKEEIQDGKVIITA